MIFALIAGLIVSMIGEIFTGYFLINVSNKLNLLWSIPLFILGFMVVMSCVRDVIM